VNQLQLSWTGYRDTSREAYEAIRPQIPTRQAEVLSTLKRSHDLTNMEIARLLRLSVNQITPRIFELRAKGLVIEAGRRICHITGHRAISWACHE
jgi:predicted transcriptional regulator